MSIPRHPDQRDESTPTKKPMRTQTKIVIGAIVALVVLMVILHVAGIAPH